MSDRLGSRLEVVYNKIFGSKISLMDSVTTKSKSIHQTSQ